MTLVGTDGKWPGTERQVRVTGAEKVPERVQRENSL